jgi:hypothetical protein
MINNNQKKKGEIKQNDNLRNDKLYNDCLCKKNNKSVSPESYRVGNYNSYNIYHTNTN